MKNKEEIKFKIDSKILNNYVDTINSIKEPMNQIKEKLSEITSISSKFSEAINREMEPIRKFNKSIEDSMGPIRKMREQLKSYSINFPNEQAKIFTDAMKQIMNVNHGMLSTRMIEPLNISRQYLSIMENNEDIEKISRGIYLSPSAFEDSYFAFQQKYKKAIFSHMNALYFYGMTEEFPYNYTVTVPQSYHVDTVNEKCNVFYVSDEIYKIGMVEVETPNGNKVLAYDKERCICDIIRSKGRMDPEQVKKSIKQYIQSSDRDMVKLSDYAKKMGISAKVMEMVGVYYD